LKKKELAMPDHAHERIVRGGGGGKKKASGEPAAKAENGPAL